MKVKLIKPHTHRGVPRKPGEEIEVRPDQAQRLAEAKKIESGPKPKLTSVKKED